MIRITSRQEGFRRCGVPHSTRPTEWPDDRFAGEELARLQGDPMLVVEVVDDPVGDPAAEARASGKAKKGAG